MTDFEDAIRAWLDGIEGDFIAAVEAGKFVAKARESWPRKLSEWLDERAETFIADRMSGIKRSERAVALHRRKSRKFADDAASVEAGDEPSSEFLDAWYPIDAANTWRLFRNMTAADLEYQITDYDQRSASNAFEAAFLRAVQKGVPKNKTVGDVFTNEQLRALRQAAA